MKRLTILSIVSVFLFLSNSLMSGNSSKHDLTLPSLDWTLEIPFDGFKILGTSPESNLLEVKISAENMHNRHYLVANLKAETPYKKVDDLIEAKWNEFSIPKKYFTSLKRYKIDDWTILEYVLTYKNPHQHNYFIGAIVDGTSIFVKITNLDINSNTPIKLNFLIEHLQIKSKLDNSSIELLKTASKYYLEKDYKNAAYYYKKCLELEKINRTLTDDYWLVMVDNLGMAYGISGDLESSKLVYEYAINEKPEYPMFHYNLACTYAEMKHLDSAMIFLRKAFQFKDNMISGESLPDPGKDSSFRKFLLIKEFRQLIDSLKSGS